MIRHNENFAFAALVPALLLAGLPDPASGELQEPTMLLQPSSPPEVRDVRWRRVGPQLTALHELYQAHLEAKPGQPFGAAIPFVAIRDDLVSIDVAAEGDVGELERALQKLGATEITPYKRLISARLPVAAIPKLADLESLRFARPAMAITRVGDTDSQGDEAMKTDEARTTFGLDGTGITVGVLSDTFDCGGGAPGSYATDIGTGDLPAGVEVLDDDVCGIDEGRAMQQLIFDVAPGAGLSFHTAAGGEALFASGIEELAGCPPGSAGGCTPALDPAEVIVDDIGYFTTPMFQDGVIAQAVDLVYGAGVSYFSAAGNSGRASWEGPFVSSGIVPPGYPFPTGDAHDFDPGPGVDIYQSVLFPPGSTITSLQWDEPFASVSGAPGSSNEIDVCVYPDPPPGAGPIGCSTFMNFGADAVEVFGIGAGVATPLNITIVKDTAFGGPDPGLLKYVAFDDAFGFIDPYPFVSASTSFGQNNAMGAIGVGASFYFDTPDFGTDPPLLESFSSAGGTPILFDILGMALPMPALRERPQIVAPDGTNTTFFGGDITDPGDGSDTDTFPNFFGTSAAAPHAAGIAALMQDAADGALTPSGIQQLLTAGTIDMTGTPGFDFDSGYGLVNGLQSVGAVNPTGSCACGTAAQACPDDVDFPDNPNSVFLGSITLTVRACDSLTFRGDATGVSGFADSVIFEDGFESGDTASWSNTVP